MSQHLGKGVNKDGIHMNLSIFCLIIGQAGAELGQAQLKLGLNELEFNFV